MKQRPVSMINERGSALVRIPLGPHATQHVEIELREWEAFLTRGYTGNLNCFLGPNGKPYVTAPNSKVAGGHVMVARVIAGAGEGQRVIYRDGNTLNLRRDNLEIRETTKKGNFRHAA